MTVDVKAVAAAIDAVLVNFDRLLQLVEDGGLQQLDDQQFVEFLEGYERVRNRLRFVERQAQLAAAGIDARSCLRLVQGRQRH
jgi:tRNA A-37 threonylcarbamoyl transferase component Bud32